MLSRAHLSAIVIVALVILLCPCAFGATVVRGGSVAGVWTRGSSPYYLTGAATVQRGNQLVIESGVQVIASPGCALTVRGVLTALGAENAPILFTAADTSRGWHGIHFINAGDGSRLLYCTITNGRAADAVIGRGAMEIIWDPMIRWKSNGGAVFCIGSRPVFEFCRFTSNEAIGNGGGFYGDYDGAPILRNCIISFNRSTHWGGGGLYLASVVATIEECSFEQNIASKWTGGGIHAIGARLTVRHSTFRGNSAYGGGGLFLQGDSSVVEGCTVTGNGAKYGGGIECNEKCATVLLDNVIEHNNADYGGGLAIVEESNVTVDRCRIAGNLARKTGGGVFIAEVGAPRFLRSVISGNASEGDGGGATCLDVEPMFEEVVVLNNNASSHGGGFYLKYANAVFRSTNIADNAAREGGGMCVENCPRVDFSAQWRSSVHRNSAYEIGGDLMVHAGPSMDIPLDTFTVDIPGDLHAYPSSTLKVDHKRSDVTQIGADLYVDPDGDDSRSGLSPWSSLRTIGMALTKVLADSLHPRTIHLSDGEYAASMLSSPYAVAGLRFISFSGGWLTDVRIGAEKIVVSTPLWKSPGALGLYGLVLASLFLLGYRMHIRQLRTDHQLKMEHFQAEHLAEVDRLKSRFFSNISHEFRTPLTLILGPAEQALTEKDATASRRKIHLIRDNARKLLGLVNQLLDFSHLESGMMKLQVSEGDVVSFLRRIVMSFESWAERKKITLEFTPEVEPVVGFFDGDKLEKIMNNLMSNALKFTPEGGRVGVAVSVCALGMHPPHSPFSFLKEKGDGGMSLEPISITVSDNGPGVAPEHLPHIFDRFYRVDETHTSEGTGIGLALVKELVQLHHGSINAESTPGKGSKFTVVLPTGRSAYASSEIAENPPQREEKERFEYDQPSAEVTTIPTDKPAEGKPIVLVVEDNPDLRVYMRECLEKDYGVQEAGDGEAGYDTAIEFVPDLIISDIMMPKMDGITLCRTLKQDVRTSHVPVILLTARAGTDSKVEGLETGADDYITKPFDARELFARVKNLIEQRRQLRQKFSAGTVLKPGEVVVTSLDDDLLRRVMAAVERHIADEQFSVEELSREACLSKTHLNRKLHALTNLGPAEFIRYVRLQRARELLEKNAGTISDIAYQVGFSSPKYFSTCFHERFGYPPSEAYRNM